MKEAAWQWAFAPALILHWQCPWASVWGWAAGGQPQGNVPYAQWGEEPPCSVDP